MTRRLAILFAAFVLLGVPEGVLGTAWPSIRESYDRPESALAHLLIAYTVGYLVASASLGRLVNRFDSEPTTRLGLLCAATGLGLFAMSPAWVLTLLAAATTGAGGGIIDSSINAEVARHHGSRTMNLLHASFGVGATIGPLLVTGALASGAGWRAGFVVLVIAEVAVLSLLVSTDRAHDGPAAAPEAASTPTALVARPELMLGATLIYFALYVSIEVSVGQWSFSVLTEARDVSSTAAGFAVSAYWGGLTAGRVALGIIGERLHPMLLLRVSVIVALAAIVWFASGSTGSIIALPVLGLAFAGVFPGLVIMTAHWLPDEMVTRAVGFQLAASSLGAISAAALLGIVADRSGLDATVTVIAVLVGTWCVVHVVTERLARSQAT